MTGCHMTTCHFFVYKEHFMPSDRFFHLPKEKQDRIIQASIKEFTRIDESEISINRIIQEAGIPRGSFYQYFKDKDDLRDYLLKDFLIYIKKEVEFYLDQDKGDMFQFAIDAICEMESIIEKHENLGLILRKACSNFQYGCEVPKKLMCELGGAEISKEIIDRMISRYYQNYDEEDIKACFEILIELIKNAIAHMILNKDNILKYKDDFARKVNIVKAGLIAKENTNV